MSSLLRRTAIVVAAVAVSAAGSLSPASAATTNHGISGIDNAIGCLTTHLCVAVGDSANGHGTVVTLKNGVSTKFQELLRTNQGGLTSISCPNSKGCVALGGARSAGPMFVKIARTGKVASFKVLAPNPKLLIDWGKLACTSVTSCIVVGTVVGSSPSLVTVAKWNGSKLGTLHKVKATGTEFLSDSGVSCHGSSCLAVASATPTPQDIGSVGVAIPIHGGTPGKPFKVAVANGLTTVACPSSTICYAAGYFANPAGVVATIKGRKVTASHNVALSPKGIACHGNSCTVAGEVLAESGQKSNTEFFGAFAPVASGTPGAVTEVAKSGGFEGVARLGSFVAMVGGASTGPTGGNAGHSEVTTF